MFSLPLYVICSTSSSLPLSKASPLSPAPPRSSSEVADPASSSDSAFSLKFLRNGSWWLSSASRWSRLILEPVYCGPNEISFGLRSLLFLPMVRNVSTPRSLRPAQRQCNACEPQTLHLRYRTIQNFLLRQSVHRALQDQDLEECKYYLMDLAKRRYLWAQGH